MKLIFKEKRFSCPHRVILVTFTLRYKKKESFYTVSKPLSQTPISAKVSCNITNQQGAPRPYAG